jgi:peptidoglycan L-alanyl-D-glutamate endopeptidase CwlK
MIRAFDGLFRRAPKPLVLRNPAPGYRFSERSLRNLEGVHPDLVRVMHRAIAITEVDFTVIEGLRTRERQKKLVEKGASTTMNSRHLTGHAVDIVPFVDEDGDGDREISWHWPFYAQLAPFVFRAASAEGVPIEWGGNWKSFPDGPHWQLPWKEYPA